MEFNSGFKGLTSAHVTADGRLEVPSLGLVRPPFVYSMRTFFLFLT